MLETVISNRQPMTNDPIIATAPRLIIRRWQRVDYQTMDRWPPFTEPLSSIWNLPDRVTVGGDWMNDIRRTYAIVLRDNTLVGRITLRNIDSASGSARLGITIGAPYVSQGYGTEGLAAFLQAFFSTLGFQTMVLDVASVNERAVRCYRRLGFQYNGHHWRDAGWRFMQTLDQATRERIAPFIKEGRHGVWVQFYDMTLARSDWQAAQHRSVIHVNQ